MGPPCGPVNTVDKVVKPPDAVVRLREEGVV